MREFLFIATALLSRITNKTKFPFMAMLFAAPLYLVGFAERTPLNDALTVVSAVVLIYFMLGFYFQSLDGWYELLPFLDRLSRGDLTATFAIEADRVGQYSRAKAIAAELNDHFSKIVAQARIGAEHISAASKEIAAGTVNLSQRTDQQASLLQGTASGMEQLALHVKQNADNCTKAKTLANRANAVAAQGGEMVDKLIGTIALINKSSSKASEITAVIEGIAFQTNILALNAAVEAHRAGQQGRGFAVVASEVRTLAQRSAAAAQEIKGLIEVSAGNVDRGTRLVDETGRVINEVVTSVQKLTQRIAEIAAASEEQATSVAEINRAIMPLERMTQHNAARVDKAAAAALSLEGEAAKLAEAVSRFKLSALHRLEPTRAHAIPAGSPSAHAQLR
jgi:methyl-accepting chemotaxis protein